MQCRYCGKEFKSETWFAKHKCEKAKIAERVGGERLLSVYGLFDFWYRYNGFKRNGKGKSFEEFLSSPYFGIFCRLFEGIQSVYIADSRDYIMWLSDNRIKSSEWDRPLILSKYKDVQDKRGNGLDRAVKSLELMNLYCDQKGIEIFEFFDIIPPSDAIRWIESGRLSPWVFLNTGSFEFLVDRMSNTHLQRLAMVIEMDYWEKRFKISQNDVDEIKRLLLEIGFDE